MLEQTFLGIAQRNQAKENVRCDREWDGFAFGAPWDDMPPFMQEAAVELAERQGKRCAAILKQHNQSIGLNHGQ